MAGLQIPPQQESPASARGARLSKRGPPQQEGPASAAQIPLQHAPASARTRLSAHLPEREAVSAIANPESSLKIPFLFVRNQGFPDRQAPRDAVPWNQSRHLSMVQELALVLDQYQSAVTVELVITGQAVWSAATACWFNVVHCVEKLVTDRLRRVGQSMSLRLDILPVMRHKEQLLRWSPWPRRVGL